jgi:hypothetical protein
MGQYYKDFTIVIGWGSAIRAAGAACGCAVHAWCLKQAISLLRACNYDRKILY